MRWTINCILLVSIAVAATSESTTEDDPRTKRDLSFIKNLLSAKFFGAEAAEAEAPKMLVSKSDNYRLFRIPGFEKILVKAIPKGTSGATGTSTSGSVVEASGSEAEIAANPSIAIVNSYLGTQKLNDTLFALQGVKNLLQSGVLDTQREGGSGESIRRVSYPSVVMEAGKVFVDGVQRPFVVEKTFPGSVFEQYRPMDVTRIPNMPLPTKYSYKQVNNGGVMSYTAKDNKNVIVSETNRPMPLPPFLTSRIQDVMYLGAPRVPSMPLVPVVATGLNIARPSFTFYNAPKVHVTPSPVKVMPTFVSSGFSFNQVHAPKGGHTPRPAQLVIPNIPSSYSYNHVHNDGSVTSYSGSGKVVDHKDVRPPIVIAEAPKPAPLPIFLTNRIETAAATAMAARLPNAVPHALYQAPVVYREPNSIIMEQRPSILYNHVSRLPNELNPHIKPIYSGDVNVHVTKHPNPIPSPQTPSGYSYKTVHADGSVSSFGDSGVFEDSKELVQDRPMFFPAKFPEAFNYHNIFEPQVVKEEICIDTHAPSAHYPNINSHVHPTSLPKPTDFSYTTVHGNGLQTKYSGSGHVEHQNLNMESFSVPMDNTKVKVPELVSQGEFFQEDLNGGKKVMFSQPVISQYVYKQINHNDPNAISVGPVPLNGEVNVKVGSLPRPTPTSAFTAPATQLPMIPSKGPSDYIYVPPLDAHEPLPTVKPSVSDSGRAPGYSFTHVTSEGIHKNHGGTASFESVTSAPIVKVVKTSSSTSSSKGKLRPKFVKAKRVSTTPIYRATTSPTTTPISLSANPIVVPDEPTFSFKQDRADGSSITVLGDKEKVSVIEKSDDLHHRGDIPNASM